MNETMQRYRYMAATALFFGITMGACVQDEPPPPDEEPAEETEPQSESPAETEPLDDTYPQPIAVLEPVSGYRLEFIELEGTDGFRGVGVAEVMPNGTPPIIDNVGLGDASPLEIFLAFSGDEVEVPASLVELYGDMLRNRQPERGSAKDEAEGFITYAGGDVACNDGWFSSWVNSSLPFDTWRLNQDGTQAGWTSYCDYSIAAFGGCSGCINATRKKYEHIRYNADEWRAYSCLHSGGTHVWACSSGSDTLPLRVYYRYRDSNNNGWYNAYVSPASNYVGENKLYAWHWYTGSNWDWIHSVRGAYTTGYDKVDLYTGWDE